MPESHDCEALIEDHSLICGAPQCCPVCCREAAAEAGLDTYAVKENPDA